MTSRQAMNDTIMTAATREMAKSKRSLLLASLDQFSKKGVDGASLADISKISGFSRPVIFKFYATKEAMAADIFTICYAGIYDKLRPIADSNAPFSAQLTIFCELSAQIVVESTDSLMMVTENFRQL